MEVSGVGVREQWAGTGGVAAPKGVGHGVDSAVEGGYRVLGSSQLWPRTILSQGM